MINLDIPLFIYGLFRTWKVSKDMIRKGYYRTKGGYQARLDEDITVRGIGVVPEWGFVAYKNDGEIVYKDENYAPHPGDSLDLLVETWQSQPFGKPKARRWSR